MKQPLTLKLYISRKTREIYQLEENLFQLDWKVTFINFQDIYNLTNRMNERRDLTAHPEETVKVGQLNAAALINEILQYVVDFYVQKKSPNAFKIGLETAIRDTTEEFVHDSLTAFTDLFPILSVQRGEQPATSYLQGFTGELSNRLIASEEMLLLYLANENPAFSPFLELFQDTDLRKKNDYGKLMASLEEFFKTQPPFGPKNNFLMAMLREPVLASPHSLGGQLDYIRNYWAYLLPPELKYQLLLSIDLIKEEEKFGALGPGPTLVPTFGKGMYEYAEPEHFTRDKDWMPKVVLLAKVAHVWLDQLSKKYGNVVNRLDLIPDEELDALARWGFTGLWLIGLWERSPASRLIKQLCGNPEALASAYSLFDYVIAEDLGGEAALENLQYRAWQRGIRLSCDMVPNHMGIYSKWVLEHPEWFIQLDHPPYPNYSFTGINLSSDPRVGLYIEDGYWERRDAAVVFKRVDYRTNEVRYIYHGNDGTSTPWNDTAQLNFLHKDAREAVIQLILHIARKFPIIRFDAAMTLTKKHYQRLWFPQPGTGGDIPSRSGRGMSREEFDSAFPKEFWREVVDRVTEEGLDALLIAEAFWLMEGYFVRTLGMHRVYNSSFMNMMKMEENAKYRTVIKNVLEFNPEILKRFVNFMNNPDEDTAIAQFGKDDKYFGAAIMMVTMPGLPMFGHGQIEGLREKYGMEYGRAYWDEEPDEDLIRRHEAEIFPLMRKRHLFSGVENFYLFDFFRTDGTVNENVFAYSNRCGEERALVLFHNKYEETKGWVRMSSAFSVESSTPGERTLIQKSLSEALTLNTKERFFYIFRDNKSGLEFIRSGQEMGEHGLYAELGAFQYHVFMGFREIQDDEEGHHARLANSLAGGGVPSIDEAYLEMVLAPVLAPFRAVLNSDMLGLLDEASTQSKGQPSVVSDQFYEIFNDKIKNLLHEMALFTGAHGDLQPILDEISILITMIQNLKEIGRDITLIELEESRCESESESISDYLLSHQTGDTGTDSRFRRILFAWITTHQLGRLKGESGYELQSRIWFNDWRLGKIIAGAYKNRGQEEYEAEHDALLVKLLTAHHGWFKSAEETEGLRVINSLFHDPDVQAFLRFNWYEGIHWLSKDAFEELIYWLFLVSVLGRLAHSSSDTPTFANDVISRYKIVQEMKKIAHNSGYRVDNIF